MKTKITLLASSFALSSCFLFHNKEEKASNASNLSSELTRFQIVPGTNSTYWIAPDPTELASFIKSTGAATFGVDSFPDPVAQTHPLAKHFQEWVSLAHKRLKETAWGKRMMVNTPEPQIYLFAVDVMNAFTLGAWASMETKVQVGVDAKREDFNGLNLFSLGPNGASGIFLAGIPIFRLDAKRSGELVDRWNSYLKTRKIDCTGTVSTPAGVQFSGDECLPFGSDPFTTKSLVTRVTTNGIVLFSGLLQQLSEEFVLATLAHELGHYYRSHLADSRSSLIDFIYRENKETMPMGAPAARSILSDVEVAQFHDKISISNARSLGVELPGETLSSAYLHRLLSLKMDKGFRWDFNTNVAFNTAVKPATFDWIPGDINLSFGEKVSFLTFIEQICLNLNPDNPAPCAGATALKNDPAIADMLNNPYENLNTVQQKVLLELEKSILPVAEQIPLEAKSGSFYAKYLDFNTLALSDGQTPSLGTRTLLSHAPKSGQKISLADVLKEWKNYERSDREFQNATRTDLEAQRIGWYTTEQEADNIGASLLATTGFRPETEYELLLKLLEIRTKQGKLENEEWNDSQCREALAKGFRDSNGNRMVAPLGGYSGDTHHAECYRIFNLYRLTKSEKFTLIQNQFNLLPAAEYRAHVEALDKQAKQNIVGLDPLAASEKLKMIWGRQGSAF